MKKHLWIVVIALPLLAALGWFGWQRYESACFARQVAEAERTMAAENTRAPFATLEWHDAAAKHARLLAKQPPPAVANNPIAGELRGRAEVAQAAADEAGFKDAALNAEAERAIKEWAGSGG